MGHRSARRPPAAKAVQARRSRAADRGGENSLSVVLGSPNADLSTGNYNRAAAGDGEYRRRRLRRVHRRLRRRRRRARDRGDHRSTPAGSRRPSEARSTCTKPTPTATSRSASPTRADLAATLVEEGDASPADVFFAQEPGAIGAVADEGLLTELPADILDRVPRSSATPTARWVGVSARVRVIAYGRRRRRSPSCPTRRSSSPSRSGRAGSAGRRRTRRCRST